MRVDSEYEKLCRMFQLAFSAPLRIIATIYIIVSILFVYTSGLARCSIRLLANKYLMITTSIPSVLQSAEVD